MTVIFCSSCFKLIVIVKPSIWSTKSFTGNSKFSLTENAHPPLFWPLLLCVTILEKPLILLGEIGLLFVKHVSQSAITNGLLRNFLWKRSTGHDGIATILYSKTVKKLPLLFQARSPPYIPRYTFSSSLSKLDKNCGAKRVCCSQFQASLIPRHQQEYQRLYWNSFRWIFLLFSFDELKSPLT